MPQLVAWFAGATVVLFLGTSVAIFGFGYYEPGWDRAYALKLAMLIGIALTAIGTVAYALMSIARRSRSTQLQALIAGAIFQTCMIGVIEGIKHVAPTYNSLITAAIVAALLGAASRYLVRRHAP